MPYRRRLLLAAALLAAAAPAAAEESIPALPCGTPEALEYTLRWHVSDPAKGGPLDGYVLLRGPGDEPGRWLEHIPIPSPRIEGRGVLSTTLGGFMNTASWSVVLIAVGPGGESPTSNVLHIPALIRGVCPPSPPTLLELMDNLIEQSDAHGADLRALRDRLAKERGAPAAAASLKKQRGG